MTDFRSSTYEADLQTSIHLLLKGALVPRRMHVASCPSAVIVDSIHFCGLCICAAKIRADDGSVVGCQCCTLHTVFG